MTVGQLKPLLPTNSSLIGWRYRLTRQHTAYGCTPVQDDPPPDHYTVYMLVVVGHRLIIECFDHARGNKADGPVTYRQVRDLLHYDTPHIVSVNGVCLNRYARPTTRRELDKHHQYLHWIHPTLYLPVREIAVHSKVENGVLLTPCVELRLLDREAIEDSNSLIQ